jgi:hypothetical protein
MIPKRLQGEEIYNFVLDLVGPLELASRVEVAESLTDGTVWDELPSAHRALFTRLAAFARTQFVPRRRLRS